MSWLQFSVEVPREQVDGMASILDDAGALSVALQDAADELLIEPVPGSSPMWEQVRVVALFDAGTDMTALQQKIRDGCPGAGIAMRIEPLADRDWSSSWRDTFNPMCFGNRLWVCPTNAECPQRDAVVVRLDPGAAFGTGTHPTTAMCLAWLDRHPPAGQAVIDYGCGSGILAIAAHRLGARHVLATDIDPAALVATRDNALVNGITTDFQTLFPAHIDTAQVDLLLANILANPLRELATQLVAYLRPGGTVLLTGILADQADAVESSYAEWIDFKPPQQRDEWVLLTGIRRET